MNETLLDTRITEFLQAWAAASVAEFNHQDVTAIDRFMDAARKAPTCADETQCLFRAFQCYERAQGKYIPREGLR